jgi:tetratricopeptide (TPR) repeat protein
MKRAILNFFFPREAPVRFRINPDIDLKEDIIRDIAKDDFEKIWAILHRSQESWDRAIADYNRAIAIEPKNALVYFSLGRAYLGKGQFEKAWENINKAREMGVDIGPGVLESIQKRYRK